VYVIPLHPRLRTPIFRYSFDRSAKSSRICVAALSVTSNAALLFGAEAAALLVVDDAFDDDDVDDAFDDDDVLDNIDAVAASAAAEYHRVDVVVVDVGIGTASPPPENTPEKTRDKTRALDDTHDDDRVTVVIIIVTTARERTSERANERLALTTTTTLSTTTSTRLCKKSSTRVDGSIDRPFLCVRLGFRV